MMETLHWSDSGAWLIAVVLIGYFLGSIPFGLIFTRMAGLGDLRDIGSGNIGATNALRTGNKWVALATFVCDAAKGAIAVLIAGHIGPATQAMAVTAAIAAFAGHVWPVWLSFKGGKGVSTFIGVMLALYWPVGLLFCATWLLVAVVTRYSSLSALLAALLTPIYLAFFDQPALAGIVGILVALVYYTHRENIGRLLQGTESRIGGTKS